MREKIIEAFNETYGNRYKSFEEIKSEYEVTEILDTWLRYEGIVGYTRDIIDQIGRASCGERVYISVVGG